jgi:hypothetical protein
MPNLSSTVNYLLRVVGVSEEVQDYRLVGLSRDDFAKVSLSGKDAHSWESRDIVPYAITVWFTEGITSLILLSDDGSVNLVEESSDESSLDEIASCNFKYYETPENIPVCFFFTYPM